MFWYVLAPIYYCDAAQHHKIETRRLDTDIAHLLFSSVIPMNNVML